MGTNPYSHSRIFQTFVRPSGASLLTAVANVQATLHLQISCRVSETPTILSQTLSISLPTFPRILKIPTLFKSPNNLVTTKLLPHSSIQSFCEFTKARGQVGRGGSWITIVTMEKVDGGGASQILMLSVCVAAIYGAYITQGVVQENVSTKRYGEKGERFEQLTFLNLAQNVVCLFWSLLMLQLWPNKNGNQAPVTAFWSSSISNAIGPACGIVALKYISYPAQVLAKSSKMIPVMFMGALVYGVRYTLPEYLCTFLVAGGVSVFALFKSSKKVYSKISSPNAPLGYALCLLNLGLDGFTNATQDSITKQYPKTTAWHIMMGMNLWGSIYTSLFMFGWQSGGGGWEAVAFLQRHPAAAWDILLFCVCGAVGQNFIFLTISRFGALTNTTITTTRKFVSILVSALWNGNPLSRQQWAGVVMVFSGLMYQIYLKWHKHSNALKQKDTKKQH